MKFTRNIVIYLLLLAAFSFAVDTLEVFAIRVQFAEEKPDNSLTTGTGLFDSDTKKKESYKLDPTGRRNSVPYWKKHFDFANAYYQKASNGNLVIKSRIFPETSSAYKLKKQIIDYNRTSKLKGEKTAEFDDARSRDYLQFVYDAVMAAHESGESPFEIPLSENPSTKRAYMIIHAGASRLVDGGSMGTKGADTPADFMDVYIDAGAWEYLPDTLENISSYADTVSKDSIRKVPNGIVLEKSAIDTLRSIMVMSETASQDGLNWGVNGIMVNQIGRELGMPNTYDVVTGISRLGYYDMMDFAGYNAGNGFLPSMPAAWERAYMGWSQVKEVRPVAGKPVTVEVSAAGTGLGTEIVKVPLSGSEYLLIENRQRSWDKDGNVSVVLGDDDDGNDTLIKTVTVDSLNYVFEDSICTKGKCSVNKKKASGIILDVSSLDAGIPASGIVVWRVNDWYLRETLEYGIANFWGGDTLRDHQFGIAMVESDGVLSIGKTFKNALGEDTYDYGAGSDLLPHKRFAEKKKYDVVKSIGADGYANTRTTQGGYTGIKISVEVPEDARQEKTPNGFMGDSVVNYGALKMKVTISIDDGSIEGSGFPRELGLNSAVRGAVFIDDPENDGEKLLVVAAEDGNLQVFNALGDTLFDADTSVTVTRLANKVVEEKVPLYRVGPSYGPLVGIASDGKDVYSLHRNALVRTSFSAGIPVQKEIHLTDSATVGPMIYENQIFFAQGKRIFRIPVKNGEMVSEREPPVLWDDSDIQDMALCLDGDSTFIVSVGDAGVIRQVPAGAGKSWVSLGAMESEGSSSVKSQERFRIACTDLDRNGRSEAIAVGSRGTVRAVSGSKVLWTKNYKRGASGTSGIQDETSGIALGDINNDGYPEVVFLGDNLVYALDRFGVPLPNFPVTLSRGTPVTGFLSDPLLVDVDGDDVPEILVPSSDGLVYAYTGKGKQIKDQFPLAAGSFEYADSLGTIYPMSIFVTDAISSKKSAGPELYAFHRSGATAFRLQKASTDAADNAAAWTLPAGGNERIGFLDASKLKKVDEVKAKDEITEFFMFPNPVRGGIAKARFEIGAEAKSATLELYDITGLCVYKKKMSDVVRGRNQFENLDLSKLGSDVYSARLQVKFKSGKTKQKLYRIGVIR
ncbi:MAG: hypothetical protein MJZ26_03085 [Fibrobacter sp.]|nr:hypothetical protein [Fibrobacter sp.]